VPVAVNSQIEKITGPLPTQTTYDVNNLPVRTVDISGVVQKWSPGTGVVQFSRDNKLLTLAVDRGGGGADSQQPEEHEPGKLILSLPLGRIIHAPSGFFRSS
jgi:hypothetical protein